VIERVCVFGLWHLGCVTAAGLASFGFPVIGLDRDPERVRALNAGHAPVAEPGLNELIQAGALQGNLSFTSDPRLALGRADLVWVTFDTPVDDEDRADPGWVRAQLDAVHQWIQPGTIVLISSQVPVGFTADLQRAWNARGPSLRFAYMPENLRLGNALNTFLRPERVVVGLGADLERERLAPVFEPLRAPVEWMSLASAEMTKHALNSFLAMCVAYTNELARICERVGADSASVERGLRTDPRVGQRAYVSAGPPFAGGTLARDVTFLSTLAAEHGLKSPLIDAVRTSNDLHKHWVRDQLERRLEGIASPRVALLGLTYKPGTDTLRRSEALELGAWLNARGVAVCAFDPAIQSLPVGVRGINLAATAEDALGGADVAVLATAWPAFRDLTPSVIMARMRRPCVIDQAGFVGHLGDDARVEYVRVGRPTLERETVS
jgi:UDPglucose 6-dehydrogenase